MALDFGLDAPQIQHIRQGETDGCRLDYTDYLRSGETISSVSLVEITAGTSAATIAGAAVSTGSLTILGNTVSAAAAVTFSVTVGSTARVGLYEATVRTTTTASRVAKRRVGFQVVG